MRYDRYWRQAVVEEASARIAAVVRVLVTMRQLRAFHARMLLEEWR